MTVQSSIAIAAELQALLTAMSSGAQLVLRDSAGAAIAQAPLANPPGVIVGNAIVLLGLPAYAPISSNAPVGDTVASADVINGSDNPIIIGLQIVAPVNSVSIALPSSGISPGGEVGVIGGVISIP